MANCVSCGSFPCVCDDECENTDPDQGYSLSTCNQGCPPPAESACETTCDPANEPLASALNNFIVAFFGTFTKVCVDGQIVWIEPCDLAEGVQGIPRIPGEGVACYLLRVYETILRSCTIDFRKIWINAECYDTWQEAYDAHQADAVPVMMLIGQGSFGDLTLTAAYNNNISIVGFGSSTSILGDIHAETATGPGYGVFINAKDVTIGNITTKTTSVTSPDPGTTGGLIRLYVEGQVFVGNLDSSAEFGGSNAGTVVITGSGRLEGGDIITYALNSSGNVFLSEYTIVQFIYSGKATSLFAGAVNLNRFVQTQDISAIADPATGSSSGVQLNDGCIVGLIDTSAFNPGSVTLATGVTSSDIVSSTTNIGKNCTVGNITSTDGVTLDDGSTCFNVNAVDDIILQDEVETGDLTSAQSVRVGNRCIVTNINAGTFITIGNDVSQGGAFTAVSDINIANNPQCGNLTSTAGDINVGNNGSIGNVLTSATPSSGNIFIGKDLNTGDLTTSGLGAGDDGGTIDVGSGCAVGNINTNGDGSGGDMFIGDNVIDSNGGAALNSGSASGDAGDIYIGHDCRFASISVAGAGSPAHIEIKSGTQTETIVLTGASISADGVRINGGIDVITSVCILRDVIFNSIGQDCVAEMISDGAQFQNCLFYSDIGECLNSTTPKTVICFNGLGNKPLPANVSLSEGNYLDSPNLLVP